MRELSIAVDELRSSSVLGSGGGKGGGALYLGAGAAAASASLTARMNRVSLSGVGERVSAPIGRAGSLSLCSGG